MNFGKRKIAYKFSENKKKIYKKLKKLIKIK